MLKKNGKNVGKETRKKRKYDAKKERKTKK